MTSTGVVLDSPMSAESLLGHTLLARALELFGEIGVRIGPRGAGVFVVHDPACPLVPASFVAAMVELASATGLAHVATRPVTDTVKRLEAGLVGGTVDRDGLVQVTSPLVLPPGVSAELGALEQMVASLPDVILVEAPALGRRVSDASDVTILEGLAARS